MLTTVRLTVPQDRTLPYAGQWHGARAKIEVTELEAEALRAQGWQDAAETAEVKALTDEQRAELEAFVKVAGALPRGSDGTPNMAELRKADLQIDNAAARDALIERAKVEGLWPAAPDGGLV